MGDRWPATPRTTYELLTTSIFILDCLICILPTRDVHRGRESAAAAPLSFETFDTATLPHRDATRSEDCRTAAAPHLDLNLTAPLPHRALSKKY